MNTVKTWQTVTTNWRATLKIGESLGQNCIGGEVFELLSDYGGGKTTLTQGMGLGLKVTRPIVSPSFTIERSYKGRLKLRHFDLYRLSEAGVVSFELKEALKEALEEKASVVVVEWSGVVASLLPAKRVIINFEQTTNENERLISITCPPELRYLELNI